MELFVEALKNEKLDFKCSPNLIIPAKLAKGTDRLPYSYLTF